MTHVDTPVRRIGYPRLRYARGRHNVHRYVVVWHGAGRLGCLERSPYDVLHDVGTAGNRQPFATSRAHDVDYWNAVRTELTAYARHP